MTYYFLEILKYSKEFKTFAELSYNFNIHKYRKYLECWNIYSILFFKLARDVWWFWTSSMLWFQRLVSTSQILYGGCIWILFKFYETLYYTMGLTFRKWFSKLAAVWLKHGIYIETVECTFTLSIVYIRLLRKSAKKLWKSSYMYSLPILT